MLPPTQILIQTSACSCPDASLSRLTITVPAELSAPHANILSLHFFILVHPSRIELFFRNFAPRPSFFFLSCLLSASPFSFFKVSYIRRNYETSRITFKVINLFVKSCKRGKKEKKNGRKTSSLTFFRGID